MRLKVLFTGNNKDIAVDTSARLEKDRGYITTICPPDPDELKDLLETVFPRVIFICVGNESFANYRAYNVFSEAAKRNECFIILIANSEDEKLFMKYSDLEKVTVFSRPVPIFSLYQKLIKIEEELKKDGYMGEPDDWEKEPAVFFDEDEPEKRHILVVDDDPEQLSNIKGQLKDFYKVTLVRSGDDMFDFLEKEIPDLILLDYMMPDMNGSRVLRKMRLFNDYKNIPVIFLTGMSEKNTVVETLRELRPQGYIIKPAKKADLVAKIIEVLG
ncbi:MAG: response regulator [Lachnospiraceae bacterium]|nr:response regulator [Lachnospiraceae bacterium]